MLPQKVIGGRGDSRTSNANTLHNVTNILYTNENLFDIIDTDRIDIDGQGWITVKGVHIPLKEGGLGGSVGDKIEAGSIQSGMSEEIDIPQEKLASLPKSEMAKKIIALAENQAIKNPPNYFDLSGRNMSLPANWKAKGFSHSSNLKEHMKHAAGVGAANEDDYIKKAINFIHSPLGKNGDVFVTSKGKIYKYDYKIKHLAIAYMDGKGTIGTYWNLGADKGPQGADDYWENRLKPKKET